MSSRLRQLGAALRQLCLRPSLLCDRTVYLRLEDEEVANEHTEGEQDQKQELLGQGDLVKIIEDFAHPLLLVAGHEAVVDVRGQVELEHRAEAGLRRRRGLAEETLSK